jgi:hypothetical protein
MAFLRFTRDTRGYEHFYLVQQTTNRRGKVRPKLLYWFRTPPNVKVGRQPFDDAVRRALEAQNPDIQFDWQAILDTPIPPPVEAEPWRERRRFERAARQAAAEETRGAASEPPSPLRSFGEPGPSSAGDLGEPGPQETTEDNEVRPPSPLRGFGEPGPSSAGDLGEPGQSSLGDLCEPGPSSLGGFGEPEKPDTTEVPGEPRANLAQGGPIDSSRRKRRRRRGRRGRPIVAAIPDRSAAPESGVPPQIETTEPSDPEEEEQ